MFVWILSTQSANMHTTEAEKQTQHALKQNPPTKASKAQ